MMKGGDQMKKAILDVGLVLALFAGIAFGAEQKMTCRITGKTLDQCCCETKNGKFYEVISPELENCCENER
jgi:hypothetical protein